MSSGIVIRPAASTLFGNMWTCAIYTNLRSRYINVFTYAPSAITHPIIAVVIAVQKRPPDSVFGVIIAIFQNKRERERYTHTLTPLSLLYLYIIYYYNNYM